jgi:hypothetical protein
MILLQQPTAPFRRRRSLAFLPPIMINDKRRQRNHVSFTSRQQALFSSKTTNNENEEEAIKIQIPPRKYGYRSTPFSWDELKQIVDVEQNLAKLSRSRAQEESYQTYRVKLLQEYQSVYDHILHSKFGYPKRYNEITERWETYPPPSPSSTTSTTTSDNNNKDDAPIPTSAVLVPNDFPYFTEPGRIDHWVLWKLHAKISDQDLQHALQELEERLGNVVDTIHWENPPHLKSLPDINHVHILVKRGGRSEHGNEYKHQHVMDE